MHQLPYTAEGLACARATLTDLRIMGTVTAEERAGLVGMAFSILQKDRAARLGLIAPPTLTGKVIHIPRALFQAGRTITQVRPRRVVRLIVRPAGPTPGDAA